MLQTPTAMQASAEKSLQVQASQGPHRWIQFLNTDNGWAGSQWCLPEADETWFGCGPCPSPQPLSFSTLLSGVESLFIDHERSPGKEPVFTDTRLPSARH